HFGGWRLGADAPPALPITRFLHCSRQVLGLAATTTEFRRRRESRERYNPKTPNGESVRRSPSGFRCCSHGEILRKLSQALLFDVLVAPLSCTAHEEVFEMPPGKPQQGGPRAHSLTGYRERER